MRALLPRSRRWQHRRHWPGAGHRQRSCRSACRHRCRRGGATTGSDAQVHFAGSGSSRVSQILIVEDDPALRNSIRSILERNGDLVRTAGDGAAGARELQTGSYDIVLLDIGLPFVDGWQILSTLDGKRLSVIVISARGEERDKVRALDMGADDYLAKPFGA